MSYRGRKRDKRSTIALLMAAAVLLLCVFSSLKHRDGEGFSLEGLGETLTAWLDQIQIGDSPSPAPMADDVDGSLLVHYIDVGQGKAILVQAPGANLLIDAGDVGEGDKVAAYIQGLGIDELHLVIATHPHADHIGGMDRVVDAIPIGDLIMPDLADGMVPATGVFTRLLEAIERNGVGVLAANPGRTYDLGDGAILQILAPVEHYSDLNNYSVVARVEYKQVSFLFTGDLEEEGEEDVIASGAGLSSTVLDVGHHGSRTSTSWAFLDRVRPGIAVISCGLDNSYGHPHREPVELLERLDTEIYRTDLDGTVVIVTDGLELSVYTEK